MNNEARTRIVFAGTPHFAVPSLRRLIEGGLSPVAVLTQPDRPSGRGRQLVAGPVKQVALDSGIPVYQPESLKNQEAIESISGLQPELMVVVAYGLILPEAILNMPLNGCWNIHASLLPRWRGAAPIQRAIEAGDRESGVCIMQMDSGLDTGPVMHSISTRLEPSETGGSLHDRLAGLGAEALIECVIRLERGEPFNARPQPATGATYARKLEKAEAHLDWSEPAAVLERRIRAFNPWPVAWCMAGPERIRIWSAGLLCEDHDALPGTVLNADKHGIDVATGKHVLRLLELQRPGKRRMNAADFLNAASLPERLDSTT